MNTTSANRKNTQTKGFSLSHGFLSGSALKIIAVISMFIDHFAVVILGSLIDAGGPFLFGDIVQNAYVHDFLSLGIGRFAFPIYCFLLVEGFFHTRSRIKYLGNMLMFAAISELPYDLAFRNVYTPASFDLSEILLTNREHFIGKQNVFFTLSLGLLCIWGIDRIRQKINDLNEYLNKGSENRRKISSPDFPLLAGLLLCCLIYFLSIYVAYRLQSDYRYYGVTLIVILYLLHVPDSSKETNHLQQAYLGNVVNSKWFAPLVGWLFLSGTMSSEFWAWPGFLACVFYNGKRGFVGKWDKYFFYFFYPLHLLLLACIRALLLP